MKRWKKIALVAIAVLWMVLVVWIMRVPACADDPIARLLECATVFMLLPCLAMWLVLE